MHAERVLSDEDFFSSRVDIPDSPLLKQSSIAAEMKHSGVDVISLAVGEPNFSPNESIIHSGISSLVNKFTQYPHLNGLRELRDLIVKKYSQFSYDIDNVVINAGAKQVIFNIFFATINQGDEVVIPSPSWASYFDIVRMFGGKVCNVETKIENSFKITAEELEKSITAKTKWLVLNSPCNPTGAVYSENELLSISKVLLKHKHVYILSDEIYEYLIFNNNKFSSLLSVEPSLFNRIFIVNGFSKGFALTGLRIGYGLCGDKSIVKKMNIVQSQCTASICSVSQYMAIQCLKDDMSFLTKVNENLKKLTSIACENLSNAGFRVIVPNATFYVFFSIDSFLNKSTVNDELIEDCYCFVRLLLKYKHVVVCAGADFGKKNFIRISVAVKDVELDEALKRIKDFTMELV